MSGNTPAELIEVWSRRYGTYALQERLKVGSPSNEKLRQRIAAIRAGNGDSFPEVRSVALYIAENLPPPPASERDDPTAPR